MLANRKYAHAATVSRFMTTASPNALDMSVTVERSAGNSDDVLVRLGGELDAWTGPTLTEALAGLCRPRGITTPRRGTVVLELRGLSFLDSGGLATLVDCRQALVDAGWAVTAGPAQPQVCRVFEYAAQLGWLPADLVTVKAC
jgi:anti-anti-sigma factor